MSCALIFLILFLARILYVIRSLRKKRVVRHCAGKCQLFDRDTKTMVVMGSGGHTTEMLKLIKNLPANYTPRIYLVANNDALSENKISTQEKVSGEFTILKIRRSRSVKQKWLSAILTTLLALYDSLKIYLKQRPDLLLVNGPGTCIPVCLVSFFFKVFFLRSSTIIFIESICRVRSLSVSGRIMYYLADQFVVQWSSLTRAYPYSTYLGWIF